MRYTFLALAMLVAAPASAQSLTIDQVVGLSSAGIGDDAIIAKIRSSGSRFDLTTDQMISLKQRGVSGPVLATMLGAGSSGGVSMSPESPDPMAPHPTGVYLLRAPTAMAKLDPTVSSQARTGSMLGYAFSYGLAPIHMKTSIQNASAHLKTIDKLPVFYFFFDDSNPNSGSGQASWLAGSVMNVTSPTEFALVHFQLKGDHREANVGSISVTGAKMGVMDKDRIQFTYNQVRPGVYRVTPATSLAPGEYGFLISLGGAASGAVAAKIYDFSVTG
jgi:hypothetical protein